MYLLYIQIYHKRIYINYFLLSILLSQTAPDDHRLIWEVICGESDQGQLSLNYYDEIYKIKESDFVRIKRRMNGLLFVKKFDYSLEDFLTKHNKTK